MGDFEVFLVGVRKWACRRCEMGKCVGIIRVLGGCRIWGRA